MRITTRQARLEADKPQKLVHAFRAARWRHDMVQRKRLGENLPDGHARIEGGIGVLEDELRVAAQRPELTLLEGRDIATVETDASRCWFDQPQHQPAERRFTAAGFAYERECFADLERKAHFIHGGHDCGRTAENRAASDELAADILDLEQGALMAEPAQAARGCSAMRGRDQPARSAVKRACKSRAQMDSAERSGIPSGARPCSAPCRRWRRAR